MKNEKTRATGSGRRFRSPRHEASRGADAAEAVLLVGTAIGAVVCAYGYASDMFSGGWFVVGFLGLMWNCLLTYTVIAAVRTVCDTNRRVSQPVADPPGIG